MNANDLVILEESRYDAKGTFQDSLRQIVRNAGASFTGQNTAYGPAYYIDITWSSQGKNIAVNSPMPIIHGLNGRKWAGGGSNLFTYGQGTVAQQAILKLAANGEYYLQFDGVDDNYSGVTNSAGFTQDDLTLPAGLTSSVSGGGDFSGSAWLGNNTVIMVLELRTAVAGHLFGRTNNAISAGRMDVVLSGGARFHAIQVFSSGTRQVTGGTNITLNTRTIGCIRLTSSATAGVKQEVFYNGTLDGTLAISDAITSSASRLDLGGTNTVGTATLNLYHLIYYPFPVDDPTLKTIHRYLGNRYGVTVP